MALKQTFRRTYDGRQYESNDSILRIKDKSGALNKRIFDLDSSFFKPLFMLEEATNNGKGQSAVQ